MLQSIVSWLDQISSGVFWACAAGLVLIDMAAVLVVLQTRNREVVNRWTSRVLAANLLLLGAGLGVPAVAYTAKLAATAIFPTLSASASQTTEAKSVVPDPAPPVADR